jgi:DNA-directed RNA polymerase alpha subunit
METRHVKLDFEEALNAKKDLLSSQLNILHTLKKIKAYGILRKKELVQKNKLRISMKSLNVKVNSFLSSLPREEQEKEIPLKKQRKRKQEKEKRNIKKELEEIKEKLAKLK